MLGVKFERGDYTLCICLFKTEQANTEVSLVQLAAGGAVRNTRKKYSTKQKRLAKIGEKFERGTIH